MKIAAVVLFACIAVSHAAFTVNLVQQAQPVLNQALFKLRLASRDGMQTQLVSELQNHANELMNSIQLAVDQGHEISQNLVNELANVYTQLNSLATSATAVGSDVMNAATGIIQNFMQNMGSIWNGITNIFGGWFGRGLGDILSSFQGLNFGSISAAIQGAINALMNHASELAQGLNLQSIIDWVMNQQMGRGFFSDWLTSMGNTLQSGWNTAITAAGEAFSTVQGMAQQLISSTTSNMATMSAQAAQQLLAALGPYAQDLGVLYEEMAAGLQAIIHGSN